MACVLLMVLLVIFALCRNKLLISQNVQNVKTKIIEHILFYCLLLWEPDYFQMLVWYGIFRL